MDIIYQSFRKRYYCARNVNGEVYIDIENNGGANNKSQNVLATSISDKIGCRDNNFYDGGYYYAELSKITLKKILKLLEDYHSDKN